MQLNNLLPAEKYTIRVTAIAHDPNAFNTKQFESLPTAVTTYTLLNAPEFLEVVSTALNSVSIRWKKPYMAKKSQFIEYVIQYKNMGSGKIDEVKVHRAANNQLNITGLAQGMHYEFRIQVYFFLSTTINLEKSCVLLFHDFKMSMSRSTDIPKK